MNVYLLVKLVHVIAVVVFMGNIFTGLFWMHIANKTRNLSIIHHTMGGIILSDRYFTVPGVLVIVAGGIWAAIEGELPLLRTGWIFWSLLLFSISGIVFGWKLAPLQKLIVTLSNSTALSDAEWAKYDQLLKSWHVWGFIAVAAPFMAMVMMVLKWPTTSIF